MCPPVPRAQAAGPAMGPPVRNDPRRLPSGAFYFGRPCYYGERARAMSGPRQWQVGPLPGGLACRRSSITSIAGRSWWRPRGASSTGSGSRAPRSARSPSSRATRPARWPTTSPPRTTSCGRRWSGPTRTSAGAIEAMPDDVHPLTRLRRRPAPGAAPRRRARVRAHARRQLLGQGAQPAGAAARCSTATTTRGGTGCWRWCAESQGGGWPRP